MEKKACCGEKRQTPAFFLPEGKEDGLEKTAEAAYYDA